MRERRVTSLYVFLPDRIYILAATHRDTPRETWWPKEQRLCFVDEYLADPQFSIQAYIKQLEENPMRTKMLTAGSLSGAQEVIASWLAKDRNKDGHYFTSRVPKMAAYGAFVSAPLGSLLIWLLQKVFKGRTSLRAKVLQILASNLIVRPGLSPFFVLPRS